MMLPPTPVQIWAGVPQGLDTKTIFEVCLMQSKGLGPTEDSVEASINFKIMRGVVLVCVIFDIVEADYAEGHFIFTKSEKKR